MTTIEFELAMEAIRVIGLVLVVALLVRRR